MSGTRAPQLLEFITKLQYFLIASRGFDVSGDSIHSSTGGRVELVSQSGTEMPE